MTVTQQLTGITVIDFTQVYMGPSCTQLLGDYGADVIKIERPGAGDTTRTTIPDPAGLDNPIFLSVNRNKRSVALDLRTPEGRAVVEDLVRGADVVVSNFRAGVMERLGLGYDAVRRLNPRAVWASGTGFGPEGPYAHKGGQDAVAQAYSGVMWRRNSEEDPLTLYPTTICDYITGQHLLQGILLALLQRERTGEGQRVDVSMYDSMLHLQMQEACQQLMRGTEINWAAMPLTGVFATTDGAVCVVGGFTRNPLRALSLALGLDEDLSARGDLATLAQQFAARPRLQQIFAERLATESTAHWIERLEQQDILCAPVHSLRQALDDEQTAVNNMIVEMDHPTAGRVRALNAPIRLSAAGPTVRHVPPRLGEHGAEVLTALGYTPADIDLLREKGVLA
ncbi:Formyl-coenzyme A transferase [Streptomyces sp. ADI96-02]|uniref:CaiB/BaiF CoA transferase family protein n=1 Tax=unclassified Streptomyces TaxID=2593676 RepID=UPI000F556EF2|nr:CoA transferase [Streptomyces sp. ADI96-02]RPK54581.1 Formyl-coenzyme A transferase [Streptomyces sp. ADI96-02]